MITTRYVYHVQALALPELWRKNNQQRDNLESAYQHGEGAQPGLKVTQHAKIGRRSHLPQTGADIIDAGEYCGKRSNKIQPADQHDQGQNHYTHEIQEDICQYREHYIVGYNMPANFHRINS